jgi:hypothetical protein
MLVQNTVDHQLYEWWITAQGTLTGIDLTASSGISWFNLQFIANSHFNNVSADDQLLVRNTSDGHFYQWWVNGTTLAGIDLGAVPPGGNSDNATFSPLGSGPLEQQSQLVTATNQPLIHS